MKYSFGEDSFNLDSISYEDILRDAMLGDDKLNSCIVAMPSRNGFSVLCSMNADAARGIMTVTLTNEGKSLFQNAFGKGVIAGEQSEIKFADLSKEKFAKIIGASGKVSEQLSFAEVIKMAQENNAYGLVVSDDISGLQVNNRSFNVPVSEVATFEKIITGGERYFRNSDSDQINQISLKTAKKSHSADSIISDVSALILEHTASRAMMMNGLNTIPTMVKPTSDGVVVMSRDALDRSMNITGNGSDYFQCTPAYDAKQELSIPVGVISSFVDGKFDNNSVDSLFLSKFALRLGSEQKINYFSGLIFQKMMGCAPVAESGQNLNIRVSENGIKASIPAFELPEMSFIKDPTMANRIALGLGNANLDEMTHEQVCANDPVITMLYREDKQLFESAFDKAEKIKGTFYELAQKGILNNVVMGKVRDLMSGELTAEPHLRSVEMREEARINEHTASKRGISEMSMDM